MGYSASLPSIDSTEDRHRRFCRRVSIGFLLLGTLLLGLAAPGFAQVPAATEDGTAESEPAELVVDDEIIVTAGRREEARSEVPARVTVVDRREIELSAARTADDLLRRVPGFSLFRRSSSRVSHPTTQGATLRGIGPSSTSRSLVLLDGVPLNDPFGGWVYWSRVPLFEIERIEVVRGGISDLWGSAALAGAIHLITEPPADGLRRVRLEAGERGEGALHLALAESGSTSAGPIGFGLLARAAEGAAYPVIRADQRGAIDRAAYSRHGTLGLRFFQSPSERTELRLRGAYFEEERGNGTPLTGNDTDATSLAITGGHLDDDGSQWQLRVSGHDQSFASTFSSQAADRNSERPALDQFDVPSRDLAAAASWSRPIGRHELGAGLDLRRLEGATNEEFFWNGERFLRRRRAGGEQELFGAWVRESWGGDRIRLTLGLRVDRWRSFDATRTVENLDTGTLLEDSVFDDRDRTTWSPRIGLVHRRGNIVLRASLYRSFRAPTLNELYRPFRVRSDITAANEELVPEELRGTELGIEIRPRGATDTVLRFGAFWNSVADAVANVTLGQGPGFVPPCGFVPAGGLCRQRRALDRVRIRGLEAELRHRPAPDWDLRLSYLWNDTEVLRAEDQPILEGRRLAQVPEHQASARLSWTSEAAFGAALDLRWVGEQFEDDLGSRALADFFTLDLALEHRLHPSLGLVLGIENLSNETWSVAETADGIVTVGGPRLIHAGLRWSRRP